MACAIHISTKSIKHDVPDYFVNAHQPAARFSI
jgi:hypothetical protein